MNDIENRPDEQPRRAPGADEIQAILREHELWLKSRGREGQAARFAGLDLTGADLRGANLRRADLRGLFAPAAELTGARLSKTDLTGAILVDSRLRGADLADALLRDADLSSAQLQGADLNRADLQGARLRRARLRDANLADTNLCTAVGLLPSQLGGTNLTGAQLPADVAKFEGLGNVAEASKATQGLFTSIVLVCAYTWLTIASTTDAQLLNNAAPPSSRLPILGVDIPLVRFYMVAPLLLLCFYVYFHLQLQRLWEELAELPAVFPDGRAVDKKAYPWLMNVLVRRHLPRLREGRSHLARWQTRITMLLGWGLVPLTIFCAWTRYLPSHDWLVTGLHIALLAGSVGAGVGFLRLASSTLRGAERRPFAWKRAWKDARAFCLGMTSAVALVTFLISFGVIEGINTASVYDEKLAHRMLGELYRFDVRRWVPSALSVVGLSSSAMITDAALSTKPANWSPSHPELLETVKGADLENHDLRHAMAFNVFAVNAYLKQADLRCADLRQGNFRLADLRKARLGRANCRWTDLREADMREADAAEARFFQSQMDRAKLEEAKLPAANLGQASLRGADLTLADLRGANLTGANLAKAPDLDPARVKATVLDGADLTAANLSGADLTGALLRPAPSEDEPGTLQPVRLVGAQLTGTRLAGADLTRANLRGARLGPTPPDTVVGLPRLILAGAKLEGADLTNADLTGADLSNANLRGATMTGSKLEWANLKGADLTGATGLTQQQLAHTVTDARTRPPDDIRALARLEASRP